MSEDETIAKLRKINEPAIICQHLLMNPDLNLNFPYCIDEDDEVWCDECEKIFLEEGGWTERALEFADLKPYCKYCFADLKRSYVERVLKQSFKVKPPFKAEPPSQEWR